MIVDWLTLVMESGCILESILKVAARIPDDLDTGWANEYSGLISFRIDRLDLLAVQITLKGLLKTIVQEHQFFSTQLSL